MALSIACDTIRALGPRRRGRASREAHNVRRQLRVPAWVQARAHRLTTRLPRDRLLRLRSQVTSGSTGASVKLIAKLSSVLNPMVVDDDGFIGEGVAKGPLIERDPKLTCVPVLRSSCDDITLSNVQDGKEDPMECKRVEAVTLVGSASSHHGCHDPPYFDWVRPCLGGAADNCFLSALKGPIRVSSAFTGIGTEVVVSSLLSSFPSDELEVRPSFVHVCSFEVNQSCREMLLNIKEGPVFGDIRLLLPDDIFVWATGSFHTVGELCRVIMSDTVLLKDTAFCHRCREYISFSMGDVCVAGVPCIDFSAIGLRRELNGKSALAILTWVKLIRKTRPLAIIFEEVPLFKNRGLPTLADPQMLGSLYDIQDILLDPRMMGLPVSRPRFYAVAVLRSALMVSRPLNELLPQVKTAYVSGDAESFFTMPLGPSVLTKSQAHALQGYYEIFGESATVVDLSQNPCCRPRRNLRNGCMPVVTCSCKLYSRKHHRCLHGLEALAAQGWPLWTSCPHYIALYNVALRRLPSTTTIRMAGNGMHIACLGLAMRWLLQFCVFVPGHTGELAYNDYVSRATCHGGYVPDRANDPCDWSFVDRVVRLAGMPKTRFGRWCDFTGLPGAQSVPLRRRDIFPLPRLLNFADIEIPVMAEAKYASLLAYVNCSIDALNYLYGYRPAMIPSAPHSAVQLACLTPWVKNAFLLLNALSEVELPAPGGDTVGVPCALVASKVDVLPQCGKVKVVDVLQEKARTIVTDGSKMFPGVYTGKVRIPAFHGNRVEYVKLVGRQLRASRVQLSHSVCSGGSCFFIAKPGRDSLRQLWNGRELSESAHPAPPPRHIANPSAFRWLRASDAHPLHVSTRDCRSWFEQLQLPEPLRKYMAQQPIKVRDLVQVVEMSTQEIRAYTDELPREMTDERLMNSKLYPTSCTWPQGFTWSPYVAQEKLLSMVDSVGFGVDRVLSPMEPPPKALQHGQSVVSLIYDDLMHFTRDVDLGAAELSEIDEMYKQEQIDVSHDKSQTLVRDGLVCGVELSNGTHLRPNIKKLRIVWERILDAIEDQRCSPRDAASLTGTLHWFDLMNRPKLANYNSVYAFQRLLPEDVPHDLPSMVAEEWLIALLAAPAWIVDLRADLSPKLLATDASTSYVLGIASAQVDLSIVEQLLSYDDARGDFVTLPLKQDAAEPRARLGFPREIPISESDFRHSISIPWPHEERPEVVELRALIAGIRWLLRTKASVGCRQIVLLDSRVVLGAARKGRSSAASLRGLLCRLSALLLISGVHLHCLYIPTEYNPSDAPSRGKKTRKQTVNKKIASARRAYKRDPLIRAYEAKKRAWDRCCRTSPYADEFVSSDANLACLSGW